MTLSGKIESLLFVASHPLSLRKLAELTGASPDEVQAAVDELRLRLNTEDRGLQLIVHGASVQLVSSPLNSALVTKFLKEEQAGELTRPSLETLTIIAYRGPISKIQLDTIRGVNCSLILRNLMIKGLVEAKPHKDKYQTTYQVTFDFVRFLGLEKISDLPDYDRLNRDERLEELLHPKPVTIVQEQPTAGDISATQPPA